MNPLVEDRSWQNRAFDIANGVLLALFAIATALPFLHIVAGSLTTTQEYLSKPFVLFPTEISFDAYRYIFSTPVLIRSLFNTIFLTVAGTAVSMLLTMMMAYALARKDLAGRNVFSFLVVFTMLFSGGMIPTFLLVRELGLLNTFWSLILPTSISAFNLIVMRGFFQRLPDSVEESAKMDGCNDIAILFRIVVPLSLPSIATISLFYAVTYWNTFMQAILYLKKADMWPIQVILRQIVIMTTGLTNAQFDETPPPSQVVNMAVIVFATVPVLAVYPFLQKYFTKGALLGSVKG